MNNPFTSRGIPAAEDKRLVARVLKGDRAALEKLIRKHQHWIYNIAIRMVGNPADAEDITQEVLIKMITHLSTFKGKSAFTTWLYQITANHVINMKKRPRERLITSLTNYGRNIDVSPDSNYGTPGTQSADLPLLIEETKIICTTGMLLCLDRQPRLAFILGAIFGVNDKIGARIMNISPDNFRQKLSRSRRKLANFMNERCGLMKKGNSCQCPHKIQTLVDEGIIDPENLLFSISGQRKIKSIARAKMRKLDNFIESRCQEIFRNAPFHDSPDFVGTIQSIIEGEEFNNIINLN
jgi:RNA polymerase sigma factor (sigma-70 family)